MIKPGSLVRAKKEFYNYYMKDVFNLEDLLLVLEETGYYTGFIDRPTDGPYQDPEVVKDITVYKLLFPKNQIFTWADYMLEEIQ